MSTPASPLSLAHWRRTVAELYATVRAAHESDAERTALAFRNARDRLFREHDDSPIAPEKRARWQGANWYPYAPAWRLRGEVQLAPNVAMFDIPLASDGVLRCARVGTVAFSVAGREARLALYWLCGYGGGLWLPFSDITSGDSTYAGGRYLYDTIKGADLGDLDGGMLLDFNYAYNPSCAYDERWSCPLSPLENQLGIAIEAGERSPLA